MSIKIRDLKGDGGVWLDIHAKNQRRRKKMASMEEALAHKAELEQREEHARAGLIRFSDLADAYVERDMGYLAPTTQQDRRIQSRKLIDYFGQVAAQHIRPSDIRAWWETTIEVPGRSVSTGRNYLECLTAMFAYGMEMGWLEDNPIPSFRTGLRRRLRTKAGRATSEAGKHIQPFAAPELRKLFAQPLEREDRLLLLTLLDTGMRLGEARGLEWDDFWWGGAEDDTTRHVWVRRSRSRDDRTATEPKSGRARQIGLSRRLRRELRAWWVERGQPSGAVFSRDNSAFRRRFKRVCSKAQIGHRRLKDFRDTYASQLLTMGIPLGYISVQLGHASVDVTSRHYARWVASEDGRVATISMGDGEIPADLLERLTGGNLEAGRSRHQGGTSL